MHSTNYFDTLILPSPDCPAPAAMPPAGSGTTIASMQYALLAAQPYALTSDEIIFRIHAERKGVAEEDRGPARMEFFGRGQACLRSSPLVKTLGWALHHDAKGRVALIDPASETFRSLMAREDVTKRPGLRSKRA